MSTAEEYFDCMDSTFYTQEELVLGAALFDYPTTMFTNHSIDWTSHVSFMFNGQCLTSSAPAVLESGSGLKVNLNTALVPSYEIFLHDPNFFLRSFNPKSVPTIENSLKIHNASISSGMYQQFVHVEKYSLLNRDQAPCSDYDKKESSFSQCVANFVYDKVSCKLKWDEAADHEVCSSIENINSIINSWVVMLTWPLEKISR